MTVKKILLAALTLVSVAWCQPVQIHGTQLRGQGRDGTLQGDPVKLPYGGVVQKVDCDGDGFWLEGPEGVVKFSDSAKAVNYRLKKGTYKAFPNLKPRQSKAYVTVYLRTGGSGQDPATPAGKSLFDGSWPATVRQHTDCGYGASTDVTISTDAQGITTIVAADGAFGEARGKVVGRTFTFGYGIKNGVATANATLTLSEDGRHFTGSFSDGSGHRGTLQGSR